MALCATPASAQPPQLIAQLRAETPISAYGEHLVWSERSRSARGFVLVDLVGGVRNVLRVRPREVPFDVDLGPDAKGRATAVYSRCKREPWGVQDMNSGQLAYAAISARDARCDLYRVTLPSGRERKLRRLDTKGDSEVLPTLWGNTIAFVRVETHRRGIAGALPHLLYRRASEPLHEIRGGTRGRYKFHGYFNNYSVTEGGPGPLQLDLRDEVLAFSWNSEHLRCHGVTDDRIGPVIQEIWRVRLGVARRRVDEACEVGSGDGASGVYGASLSPLGLSYLAEFPTRGPDGDRVLQTWSPGCALQSLTLPEPGIPAALTTSDTDRYLLMRVAEHSFELWREPLPQASPC